MKTNYQDPGSSELVSPDISGLQEAAGKIEDILDMDTTAETGVTLTEVYISAQDRYRIFQAPAGKRNWVLSPAPVIKKNDVVISSGFEIKYAGGAIVLDTNAEAGDTFTADVTYTNNTGQIPAANVKIADAGGIITAGQVEDALQEIVTDANSHLNDYEYQIPTIVGTQIQLIRRSSTNVLKFKLASELSGGNITISLDGGTTSKNLQDIDGEILTSLDAGFVEVIEDTTFFTLRPRGAGINGIIGEYQIASGSEDISAGDFVDWINNQKFNEEIFNINNGSGVSFLSASLLEENKALIVFKDIANSNFGTARILTFSGGKFIIGDKFVFNSADTINLYVDTITSNKVLVGYADRSNNDYGTAIVLQISGETITSGTPVVFNASLTRDIVISFSENGALVTYNDQLNSNAGVAIILSVSGTVITSGTPFIFNGSFATNNIFSLLITPSSAIVTFRDGENSGFGAAKILQVSGTTITAPGNKFIFNNFAFFGSRQVQISPGRVLLAHGNGGTGGQGVVRLLDISGSTISSPSSEFVFELEETGRVFVISLDSNSALISYESVVGANRKVRVKKLNIDDTTITQVSFGISIDDFSSGVTSYILNFSSNINVVICGSLNESISAIIDDDANILYELSDIKRTSLISNGAQQIFSPDSTSNISSALIDTNRVLIAYRDIKNSNFGTAVVVTIFENTITVGNKLIFNSNSISSSTGVVAVRPDNAIIAFNDDAGLRGRAAYVTVSSSVISLVSTTTFNSDDSFNISVARISFDRAVVCYTDAGNGNFGTAKVVFIFDTHIGSGASFVFADFAITNTRVVSFDNNRSIVAYSRPDFGSVRILDVSGSSVTSPAAETSFETNTISSFDIAFIEANKVFVSYKRFFDSLLLGKIITISGNVISVNEAFNMGSNGLLPSAKLVNTNIILLTYRNLTISIDAFLFDVSGSVPIALSEGVVVSRSTSDLRLEFVSLGKALLAYRDVALSNAGASNMVTINNSVAAGVAKQGGSGGDVIQVYTAGVE